MRSRIGCAAEGKRSPPDAEMPRQTSLAAYDELKKSGSMAPDEESVLSVLVWHPSGLTDQEIAEKLGPGWYPSRVSARRNGLRQRLEDSQIGYQIIEKPHRPCKVTGHMAIPWAVEKTRLVQLEMAL